MQNDRELKKWESKQRKSSYAAAYDHVFKLQLKNQLKLRRGARAEKAKESARLVATLFSNSVKDDTGEQTTHLDFDLTGEGSITVTHESHVKREDDTAPKRGQGKRTHSTEYDRFIHIFAAPVFRMVAANWARLIVRRGFDLDLIEWRDRDCLNSQTIEEIKSRRIAINRHQKDIQASLDTLYSFVVAEGGQKIKDSISFPDFNLANGLAGSSKDKDSWWNIFWDFVELKKSMDSLERRASKIHDSSCSMIGIVCGEYTKTTIRQGWTLNFIVAGFSILTIPFAIVSPIFTARHNYGYPAGPDRLAWAVCVTASGIFLLFLALFSGISLFSVDELSQRESIRYLREKWREIWHKSLFKNQSKMQERRARALWERIQRNQEEIGKVEGEV